MAIKIAINGFGRIGRNILRAIFEYNRQDEFQVVGINDLSDINILAHLAKYDSTHGRFPGEISVDGNFLVVNGQRIAMCAERDPSKLPWAKLGVDVVHECTGHFTSKEKSQVHIAAGAKKVIISAPAGTDADATIVYGVNHKTLKASDTIISNASCTTNCLAPLVKPLHEKIGILNGLMTTIHAYTNDQNLLDAPHSDLHRARAAALSMIPSKTGAASAVGLVLPELNGRLDGFAIRVPIANVSIVDLTFTSARETNVKEVNAILKSAADNELKNILAYSDVPLVSIDFNHNPASSIFDASLTRVNNNVVKVCAWYDNEWGFANRMLDTTVALVSAKQTAEVAHA
jgi:glyceraldehyde 3-phosphate dehydrogenase